MTEIECPACHHRFELSDAVAGPLVLKARAEADLAASARIAAARKQIEAEAQDRARESAAALFEKVKAEAAAAKQHSEEMANILNENNKKLAEAQQAQAEAMRKQRELEDAKRELNLTIERRTAEGVAAARAAADRAADERVAGRIAEKEQTIAAMQRTVEELRRKAEQGSQQVQGESQELALERDLKERFPLDSVEPIGKGTVGADCILAIQDAGRILFECKNTKAWSNAWLPKLRDDGRAANAEVLVLVTVALPQGLETFDCVDGVWVCAPKYALPLCAALRQGLVEAAGARRAGQQVETKAGVMYAYLTGPKFRNRISAIVEAFTTMKEDLDAERRAITKQWVKRESQIERLLQGTTGMYGDLQAIAGRALPELERMDLLAPPP